MEQIPITEFDPDKKALIEPGMMRSTKVNINPPEHCIMPIYGSLIEKLKQDGRLEKIHELHTPFIPIDIHKMEYNGRFLTVCHPGVCAAWAASHLEELIALGCRKFIACGSAGALKPELNRGVVIIPSSALRDEGTSYHYCPPSRTITMDPKVVQKLESVLRKHNVNYQIGKTWTTDGFYRETKGKITRRKSEGCVTVDMECSAFLAVAKFRNVTFGQYLVAGDDVSGDEWDPRYVDDKTPFQGFQEKIFWLSVEACLEL